MENQLQVLVYAVGLLWALNISLVMAVIALARQVGILHERIAPIGALVSDRGPEAGDQGPNFDITDINGQPVEIGGSRGSGYKQLLFFMSPDCPVCKKLIPITEIFSKQESVDVIYISDGSDEDIRKTVNANNLVERSIVNSPEIGMRYGVGKLPYAVLLDSAGIIRAKGLVNSREQLESLLIADSIGSTSMQDYFSTSEKSEANALLKARG